jgi:mannose-6-phosphate isomerase-like protein (cupin superfamily)
MGAQLHGPGEGERHAVGPAEVVIKATSDDFFLSENILPPEMPGPPPHTHGRMTDMFYVLEGTLTVLVEDEWHELGAGSFAAAPPGVTHAFRNDSGAPVRFLNLSTPGGWERFMRDLSDAVASEGITPEVMATLSERHDVQLA